MKKLILTVVISMAMFVVGAAQAQTYNLTLSGASPGGLWSRIGSGIDAAISKAYPGSTVTYQTSSGGFANIALVSRGKVPMGIATDGELTAAWRGVEPFNKPIKNVRTLFRVYRADSRFQMTHVLVSGEFAKKHNVTSFDDIVNNKLPIRVGINRKGNQDSTISLAVMNAVGLNETSIENWGGQVVNAGSKELVSLALDRRIDVVIMGVAFNHPRIREIVRGLNPVLLDIPSDAAETAADQIGGEVCKIKAGEYKWSTNPANSVCVGAVVVVNADMDNEIAKTITNGVVRELDEFKEKSHRLIKSTASLEVLSTPAIAPHHDGSKKVFD